MNYGQYLMSLECKCGETKPCGWDQCRQCIIKEGQEFRANKTKGEIDGVIRVSGWKK